MTKNNVEPATNQFKPLNVMFQTQPPQERDIHRKPWLILGVVFWGDRGDKQGPTYHPKPSRIFDAWKQVSNKITVFSLSLGAWLHGHLPSWNLKQQCFSGCIHLLQWFIASQHVIIYILDKYSNKKDSAVRFYHISLTNTCHQLNLLVWCFEIVPNIFPPKDSLIVIIYGRRNKTPETKSSKDIPHQHYHPFCSRYTSPWNKCLQSLLP